MKDLANNLLAVQSLAPAVRTADANGTGVDLQGFEGAMVIVDMGAEGDTLSSSVKIDYKLEESSDDSTYTAVTSSSSVTDGAVDSSGIFATFDANAEAPRRIRWLQRVYSHERIHYDLMNFEFLYHKRYVSESR